MPAAWPTRADSDPHPNDTSRLLQAIDWAETPLGAAGSWPPELRVVAALVMRSAAPQFIVWGPRQTVLYNDGCIPFLGERHPSAFARPLAEVWPGVAQTVAPLVHRAFAGLAGRVDDQPWPVDQGTPPQPVWMSLAATPVEGPDGAVLGVHCTLHETTPAVRARQELRQVTQELSSLAQERQLALDAARLGWWQFDPHTGLVRHDARYAEIYGLSPASPRHVEQISALLHPDDAPRLWEAVTAATLPADPKPYCVEYRIHRPDGTTRWLEARGIASFEGEGDTRRVLDFVGTVADVTERRLAEDLLRENERHFRLMADTSPAVLWLADPAGQCTFLSREWYAVSGQTEAQALGLGWTMATHPDDRQRASEAFVEANAARRPFRIEYRLRTADGRYRWAVDLGRPWFTEGGDYAGMVGVVFDIDDRKRAEQALEDQSRRKDEFLAMLAHELRNPLAPIGTAAEILKRSGGDALRTAQSAAVIERQVRHLTSLVDDLLDVSRVTRGLVSIAHEPVDIRAVVTAALEQAQPQLHARGHTLHTSVAAGAFVVDGDFNRLVQVLANLLNNAAKYTPRNGRIDVRIGVVGQQVHIAVADNGIGIPAALLPEVFELFTQAERTPDRAQGGLGIGLALVRSLVKLHGGTVDADSAGPNRGSTFTVRLPLSAAPAPAAAAVGAGHPAGLRRRILIVDDNRDAAHTLAELLRLVGHEVAVAADGASALEQSAVSPWDTCILDIGLPDMTGLELATRLRSRVRRDAVFIALTGYGQEQDRALSAAAGFDHHLVKPPDIARLLALLAPRAG